MNKEIIEKIKQAKKLLNECLLEIDPVGSESSRLSLIEKNKDIPTLSDTENSEHLILSIVNKIGECDEGEDLQTNIIDKTPMEGKILLCFFISHKYFKNAWLTTGDVEKITSNLGTKIASENVSKKIKGGLRQYLESSIVTKKGQPTPYRINRKGIKRFEEIFISEHK